MISLYVIGIAVGILMALVLKGTLFKGGAVPFVMELPNYRMPGAANVGRLLWDKARDFMQRKSYIGSCKKRNQAFLGIFC